jgi:hypothetical protein
VRCQLDVLSKLKDRRSVTVERTLERLPTDLHTTYQRLLATIPSDDRALVLRMLHLVALSARPVTLDEVCGTRHRGRGLCSRHVRASLC